jgi:hypothetical protein
MFLCLSLFLYLCFSACHFHLKPFDFVGREVIFLMSGHERCSRVCDKKKKLLRKSYSSQILFRFINHGQGFNFRKTYLKTSLRFRKKETLFNMSRQKVKGFQKSIFSTKLHSILIDLSTSLKRCRRYRNLFLKRN